MSAPTKRPLVIGLGNEILSDDGFGIAVAQAVAGEAEAAAVDIMATSLGGFHLLDYLEGRDALLLIDAAQMPGLAPGKLRMFSDSDFTASGAIVSQHQADLPTVIRFGRELGMRMPLVIDILLCGAEEVTLLREGLTACVAAALPVAVKMTRAWIATHAVGPAIPPAPERAGPPVSRSEEAVPR
jgi:hydrogenase maturation protease